jgi:hypothetical protein
MALTKDSKPTEVVEAWVKALRSRSFKQGRGALHTRGTHDTKAQYCCLGILCNLAVKAGIVDAQLTNSGNYAYNGSINTGVLPLRVKKWAGISHYNGSYGAGSLINDNDIKGKTFKEIAAIIESKPRGLFVAKT